MIWLTRALIVSWHHDADFVIALPEPGSRPRNDDRYRFSAPEAFTDELVVDEDLYMVSKPGFALETKPCSHLSVSGYISQADLKSRLLTERPIELLPEPFGA